MISILFRLKSCEVVVSGLDDVKQMIHDYQHTLASQDNATSDLSSLKLAHTQLTVSGLLVLLQYVSTLRLLQSAYSCGYYPTLAVNCSPPPLIPLFTA